jgi:hypothetical protein
MDRFKFFAINREKGSDDHEYMKNLSKDLGINLKPLIIDPRHINSVNTEIPHIKLLSYNSYLWLHNTKDINQFHMHPPSCNMLAASVAHLLLYNELLIDDDADFYCIFEDDVCLVDPEDKSKFFRVLNNLDYDNFEFDVCLLFQPMYCTEVNRKKYSSDIDVVDKIGFGGSYAYIISKRGAGKMVTSLQHQLNRSPDDHLSNACSIDGFMKTYISPIFTKLPLNKENPNNSCLNIPITDKPYASNLYVSKNELCTNFKSKSVILEKSVLKNQNSYTEFRDSLSSIHKVYQSCFKPSFHFVWVKGYRTYSIIQYLAVRAALDMNPGYKLLIYNDEEPVNNEWWELTKRYATVLRIKPPKIINGKTIPYAQHIADIMRICIIYEFGGIYIDADLLMVKPLEILLSSVQKETDLVMCKETDNKIWNGFIATKEPRNCFLERWIKEYETKYGDEIGGCWWAGLSVETPMRLYKESENDLHLVDTHNFLPFGFYDDTIYREDWSEGVYNSSFGLHLWETEAEKRGVLPKNKDWFLQHPSSIFAKSFAKYLTF